MIEVGRCGATDQSEIEGHKLVAHCRLLLGRTAGVHRETTGLR
jgi:hypothetical protein